MANKHKGELAFEHEGTAYTLVLGTNELVELQQMFSTSDDIMDIGQIDRLIRKGSVLHMRALFWAMLQRHHKAIAQTPEAAGELLDEIGESAKPAILSALGLSAPDPKDVEELETANPPKAQASRSRKRGGISSSTQATAA